jgi:hypothetical protein
MGGIEEGRSGIGPYKQSKVSAIDAACKPGAAPTGVAASAPGTDLFAKVEIEDSNGPIKLRHEE